ncbi:MAG: (2Fe-2S)-binding protein [Deltaproteobacteria bacterium]|nr:(2Fe-2S)-binding protein [Deltaproteobacteria bacterium]
MITITVDSKEIQAEAGASLLEACLENDIYIPHLCHVAGMQTPPASCRLCMVAVVGVDRPVTACTTQVAEGMVVETAAPEVRHLQRTALRLLLSVHDIDCKNCHANKHCELQNIARFLKIGLRAKPYDTLLEKSAVDRSHPFLDYLPNRCVLCGKCMYACREKNGQSMFTYAGRGFDTVISAFGVDSADVDCAACLACVDICPVGALVVRENGGDS